MKKKSIVTSALILTMAGIITRILGFVYRIYMSNVMGAEGMGLYQLIMPVYSLAWSVACSGFTTTISKLTAQERAKGEYGNMGRFLKQSIFITTSIGLILAVGMFLFAAPMAQNLFKDNRTILPLKILSLALPFMAAGTCVRSYFIGQQETMVPAINQVLEQCVRMIVIYLLAGTFIPLGLEYACAAAVIGIVCEEAFSFVYIMLAYKKFKSKNSLNKRPTLTAPQSLAILFTMALPLTLNRVSGSLLATFENALIPQRLVLFGLTHKEAMSAYGQITGMVMPLIFFPSALLNAISTTLVPSVSEALAVKNYTRISYTVSKSMLFAAITGVGAASVFILFADKLGYVIYKQDIGAMLLPLGIMCPFMYIQVIFSGILNGMGFQALLLRNSLISSVINISFIYFLVPVYGINAFIIGWFVSLVIISGLEIGKIQNSIDLKIQFKNWFLKPVISGTAAGLAIRYAAYKYIFPATGDIAGLVISITLFLVFYVMFIILTGCLTREEIGGVVRNVLPRRAILKN